MVIAITDHDSIVHEHHIPDDVDLFTWLEGYTLDWTYVPLDMRIVSWED